MKVLRGTAEDGYLDQALLDGWVRVAVVIITRYPPQCEQFFRRELDLRFALPYVREIGMRDAVRKVRSRLAERVRNDRCVVAGLGRVIQSRDPQVAVGNLVPFVVPDSGPPSERYAVPADLVGGPWEGPRPDVPPGTWRVLTAGSTEDNPGIGRIAGWNGDSGAPLPLSPAEIRAVAVQALRDGISPAASACSSSPVTERAGPEQSGAPGLTVFGYGNYTKTMIIPQLGRWLPVRCVHEIDPWQIGRARDGRWAWDTSPVLRPGEHPDVVVVAGFHHTHASVAVDAIRRGARAVIIEKPVVTTSADLDQLCNAAAAHQTPVFSAFQRRYSPFNRYLRADLRVRPGEPVSCLAVAYEVPLPPLHWYRWPNSGSAIISNGCHWIDHFLYLNDFSPARQIDAVPLGDAALCVRIVLENGAALSLSLTHVGSPRLGVREHCEFRAGGVTATITDSKHYLSESARGVIRKERVHRYAAYKRMYRTFGEAIAAGGDGDPLISLRRTGDCVLAAEAALAAQAIAKTPVSA